MSTWYGIRNDKTVGELLKRKVKIFILNKLYLDIENYILANKKEIGLKIARKIISEIGWSYNIINKIYIFILPVFLLKTIRYMKLKCSKLYLKISNSLNIPKNKLDHNIEKHYILKK